MTKADFIHNEKLLKDIFGEPAEECREMLPCGCCKECGCICDWYAEQMASE